jgi:ATP-binding cassette, subfamily B, bacterial
MQNPSGYAGRPLAFVAKYVLARPVAHATIITAVMAAVTCSVGAQYAVKVLVDTLSGGLDGGTAQAWWGFFLLASLIGADNLLW